MHSLFSENFHMFSPTYPLSQVSLFLAWDSQYSRFLVRNVYIFNHKHIPNTEIFYDDEAFFL